ncbi:MAG: arginine--tRNA ligase [Christensenellaceae bacterium]|nr:arginine--tRNA ligase [Christensenellaceae bacterium]
MDYPAHIAQKLFSRIQGAYGMEIEGLEGFLETPPDPSLGDYAFPCFKLSKALRAAPPKIAQTLAEGFAADEYIAKLECAGGYLNFFLNQAAFAAAVLDEVLQKGEKYGASGEGQGRVVCIDYSSINIAKRFHIGHLSTTMIGNALKNLYNHLGYKSVGINHLGDWGTQFGRMIAAYLKWGSREMVEEGGVKALMALYVRFHEEVENDKSLEDEGRFWFKKIEEGDAQALEIFAWFKELTLKDAARVYETLGVSFDSYAGESFYNDKMGRVVDELRQKGLLVESQGAYVVDLEAEKMPPCIILKKDGATLYATRDIAAALYRKDNYDFAKSLYVVAYQQDLHFRQVFKTIEKMGYDWAADMEHVSFGMISYEGETLSTRKGNVVYLEDVLEKAVEKARAIMEEKSPELEGKDEVARQVGIGAVIFFDLFNSRIKDIDFYWDRVLNFDGETGPYVQYSHARCCSVLRRGEGVPQVPDYEGLNNPQALAVLRALERFPQVLREACQRNEPYLVARFSVELAQAYNRFYYEHQILGESAGVSAARLRLTRAAQAVLRLSLSLIGIQAPERM